MEHYGYAIKLNCCKPGRADIVCCYIKGREKMTSQLNPAVAKIEE